MYFYLQFPSVEMDVAPLVN